MATFLELFGLIAQVRRSGTLTDLERAVRSWLAATPRRRTIVP